MSAEDKGKKTQAAQKKPAVQQPQANQQDAAGQQQQQQLQVHVSPELDYSYRDFFSIYVGAEEVIIEFGNRHRAQSDRASIHNRIVLSVANAFRLQQGLGRSLQEARRRIQEAQQQVQDQAQQQEGGE